MSALKTVIALIAFWEGIVNYRRTCDVQIQSFIKSNSPDERNMPCNEANNYVSMHEFNDLKRRLNLATNLVKNQALNISRLKDKGTPDSFQENQIQSVLEECYNLQGMCIRTKNVPFPRQYGYFMNIFTSILMLLLPFGQWDVFKATALAFDFASLYIFLMISITVLISWIFATMENIVDNSGNPFEGTLNDMPMTALCRTIEIDLRDMLNETELPEPMLLKDNTLY